MPSLRVEILEEAIYKLGCVLHLAEKELHMNHIVLGSLSDALDDLNEDLKNTHRLDKERNCE